MSRKELHIVPRPKRVEWTEGIFTLDDDTQIALLPGAGEAEAFAARSLQKEIEEATGLDLPLIKISRPVREDNFILLTADDAAAGDWLGEPVPWAGEVDEEEAHGQQLYHLHVSPQRVVAGGQGTLALHYAVQTLRQVARMEHARWPAFYIRDWPSLAYRGVMLDISRGKVPTLETFKRMIDYLSLYKINVLQLYTEHTFKSPHHPRIGEDCGSLTSEDILALDDYAYRRHVELMPNLQSFGHRSHTLNTPGYTHLAESDAARWSLCPVDEGTYDLLKDLYDDFLPAFRSRIFNVDCDETWDLGKGRSAEAVAERGVGRVYLEHILRLYELARRHGCRIQLWGDILLQHPELVSELPKDVILLDWHYQASDDYPSVRTFAQSGRAFWVCPGTSSWNALFPRIENANVNIRTLARLGSQHGAEGLLNTDWGDHGHYQPLGLSWYGYAYGAEQSWTGGETEDADFEARFGPVFFGASGARVVEGIRRLAALNALPGMDRRNASNSVYALLDEPLVGEMVEHIPAETLEEIVDVCRETQQELRSALPQSRAPLTIKEMVYSADMMAYAAHKVRTSQAIRDELAALAEGAEEGEERLREAISALRDLDAELVQLKQDFETIWLRRARRAEISITLDHFAGLRERYARAQEWLEKRLDQLETGQTPSYDLDAYTQEAQGYEILGQAFWKRMHEAGVSLD
ncbi:MAG: family 20 glycosylhydrolase [Chloroflexota bacterium]|nr:family 20 glycosylhydrolase [Chloroflexota bacterium]